MTKGNSQIIRTDAACGLVAPGPSNQSNPVRRQVGKPRHERGPYLLGGAALNPKRQLAVCIMEIKR